MSGGGMMVTIVREHEKPITFKTRLSPNSGVPSNYLNKHVVAISSRIKELVDMESGNIIISLRMQPCYPGDFIDTDKHFGTLRDDFEIQEHKFEFDPIHALEFVLKDEIVKFFKNLSVNSERGD